MPNWTKEQQLAIHKDDQNIIVSAGAGSGKTAVLSERVIRKLEQGVDIDRLLILTFTKAAAFEMMIRIRNKIKEKPALKSQLDKIDSAYITTFDSFALSIVKKYHYVLGIKKDVQIINPNIIQIEKKKCLDRIFETYYSSKNDLFLRTLDKYTLKDDEQIKKLILELEGHLDLKYDQQEYLETYIEKNFQTEEIEKKITQFENFLHQIIEVIKKQLSHLLEYVDEDYGQEIEKNFERLLSSKTYEEILANIEIPRKNLPKDSSEEAKKAKEILLKSVKELQELLIYQNREEIRSLLEDTKPSIQFIIEVIQEFNKQMTHYKNTHASYEFTDISKMAIWLVKENQEINRELKEYFEEIMVDEYQDTSDLQELFIQSIAHDNIYMVGDIKQSIYRFRNANPYLFKEKYDAYGREDGGYKIDLMKNFRSRKEVLENINFIFNYIMDDFIGGCKYKEEHQMIFGNLMYEKNQNPLQNSNMEIYNYVLDQKQGFSKDEIEAFLIAKDIQTKILEKYQVIDSKTTSLRDCTYSDFTILSDTSKNFELYNKIFEYLHIPLAVYKDTSITKEDDIYILNNLLKLTFYTYHKQYNEEFRYAFLSIARSYITEEVDRTIFSIIKNNQYLETDFVKKLDPILKTYSTLNGVALLEKIIDQFDLYKKQIRVGNMDHFIARMNYIKTLFKEMDELGYTLDEIIQNFNQMVDSGYEIKVSFTKNEENAVKIMTIHKSKGLEFPILYMTGLSNKFNIKELNEKFIYDNTFGIMVPFYKNQEITNILKPSIKDRYIREEVSEKIRLFYVALTRAKEKMILVTSLEQEEKEIVESVSFYDKTKYRSFLDILKSIWGNLDLYRKDIPIDQIQLTKDYNFIKAQTDQRNSKEDIESIHYREIEKENPVVQELHYSKTVTSLLTKEEQHAVELGKRFHSIFENLDFKRPDLSQLTAFEKRVVKAFLNLEILEDLTSAEIYQEYEFIFENGNEKKHGVIDLMIEYPDRMIIIDYKLKEVRKKDYEQQLIGYKSYIEKKTSKPIELYLYSILDQQLTKLDKETSFIY